MGSRFEVTARYSSDGLYRWNYTHRWDDGPIVAWVALNPGTGDTNGRARPTLSQMVKWSDAWEYKGLIIVNLFAWRDTDPAVLEGMDEAKKIGDENDDAIEAAVAQASLTIACWGNKGRKSARSITVARMLKTPKCLGFTEKDEPLHPNADQAKKLCIPTEADLEVLNQGRYAGITEL